MASEQQELRNITTKVLRALGEGRTMASKQTDELNKVYLEWVAALKANPEMPLDELRHMFEQWGRITGEPGGVDYIETDAGGVPALWAAPKNCAQDRVLLCAHGGGYVAGSMYTHRKVYAHVAKAIGCRALIVHYGRAPENVHPGPVNDMVRSYKWLLDQGIRPGHVALIGDSAGGALAVTTILRSREQSLPLPAATMPLSPWLDMEATGETFETNAARDLLVSATSSRLWPGCSSAKAATATIRSPIRCTLTSRASRPCISRPGPMRHCSTTAASWPSSRASPASM
jgi:acetyl esterase/lipase